MRPAYPQAYPVVREQGPPGMPLQQHGPNRIPVLHPQQRPAENNARYALGLSNLDQSQNSCMLSFAAFYQLITAVNMGYLTNKRSVNFLQECKVARKGRGSIYAITSTTIFCRSHYSIQQSSSTCTHSSKCFHGMWSAYKSPPDSPIPHPSSGERSAAESIFIHKDTLSCKSLLFFDSGAAQKACDVFQIDNFLERGDKEAAAYVNHWRRTTAYAVHIV